MGTKNTTLDDIAAEIGLTATLRLSAWFGDDNKCYVPFKVDDGQLLVRLIGLPAARRLSEAFPGELLAIPRLTQYEDDLRDRQIGQLLTKGFTTRQIATWVRLSERRVQQICQALEVAGLIEPVGPGKKPTKNLVGKNGQENALQKAARESGLQKTVYKIGRRRT